jgi:hydroxyacylglutathione hydrolase
MRNVAKNVWQLSGFPVNAINAYLVEDVLIDAGTRFDGKRILKSLAGVDLKMVAITHCHPDHQGAVKTVCEQFNCPLACHDADKPAMEGAEPMKPTSRPIRLSGRVFSGPPHRVDRALKEGDEIAGFRVVEAPGHTMGHVMFFRERDGVAIAGDVAVNMNLITLRPGLHEPPGFFCVDAELNRRSIRKLADLEPSTVLFGHGPPLVNRDALRKFADGMR